MSNQFTFQKLYGSWYLLPIEKFQQFHADTKHLLETFPHINTDRLNRVLSGYLEYKIDFVEDYIFENPQKWREIKNAGE